MRQAGFRPLKLSLLLAALAVAAGGCVYRMDVQQGNLLDQEQIDQVQVGMTRSQVRFLLGTPMVADTFTPERWDYVYRLRHGKSQKLERRHLVIWFDGDNVQRIEEPVPAAAKPSAPAS